MNRANWRLNVDPTEVERIGNPLPVMLLELAQAPRGQQMAGGEPTPAEPSARGEGTQPSPLGQGDQSEASAAEAEPTPAELAARGEGRKPAPLGQGGQGNGSGSSSS